MFRASVLSWKAAKTSSTHLSRSLFLGFDNRTTFCPEDDMKILVNTGLKSVYKGLVTEGKEGHE